MIEYHEHTLENGLRLFIHEDDSTPMVAVNILYDVGARDEDESRTGFAHLFEHLMFGGSENIPDFDTELQKAGGENNAFTSNDITNYYDVLPAVNLETALWLESDRMNQLDFSPKSLEVQRKVVIEEFKENYLNQPYGDVQHKLRNLLYKEHPYKWPTIGKSVQHIEEASLEDVVSFFNTHYRPDNAILTIAGGIKKEEVIPLVEKWFSGIKSSNRPERNLTTEPSQNGERREVVEADVPVDALYMAFISPDRSSSDYHTCDLISDILSNGASARLHQRLVKETAIFSDLHAYISGSLDQGYFIVEGKLAKGINFASAEEAVWNELELLKSEVIPNEELQKVKNKIESSKVFSDTNILNKAMNLSYHALLGDVDGVNTDMENYLKVGPADIQTLSQKLFQKERLCVINYKSRA